MSAIELLNMTLGATLRMSTPLLLAAMGGMFARRSGIMALGLEGMISIGAFSAVLGSYLTNSGWIGLLFGIVVPVIFALFNAWLCIRFHVNHVISGLGINMTSAAVTAVLLQVIWNSSSNSPAVNAFKSITVEGWKDIPILGALFSNQSALTYFAIALVPVLWWLMFQSVFGLRVRIIGNNPYSASTAGVNVNRYKYISMAICGALAGLAGTYLSLCQLNLYMDGMSAERGYIANVITVLGCTNPVGILGASLFFGLIDASQLLFADSDIPVQLLRTLPYLATLLALAMVRNNKGKVMFIGKHFEETH